MKRKRKCKCCGRTIKLMCQVWFCSGRCEDGKCGHPKRKATS